MLGSKVCKYEALDKVLHHTVHMGVDTSMSWTCAWKLQKIGLRMLKGRKLRCTSWVLFGPSNVVVSIIAWGMDKLVCYQTGPAWIVDLPQYSFVTPRWRWDEDLSYRGSSMPGHNHKTLHRTYVFCIRPFIHDCTSLV